MGIKFINDKEIKQLKESAETAITQYNQVVEQNKSLQQENMFFRNVIKEFCVQFRRKFGYSFKIVDDLEKVVK